MGSVQRSIAIIGGGPRGISVLERLLASYRELAAGSEASATLRVDIVDEFQPGAGRVWRTTQPGDLVMNTLADAVTLFPEPGASVASPILQGPTMYEWVMLVRGEELGPDRDPEGKKAALFRRNPVWRGEPGGAGEAQPGEVQPHETHARDLEPSDLQRWERDISDAKPNTHPARSFYGAYLRWAFSTLLGLAPEQVEVHVHQAKALSIGAANPGEEGSAAEAPGTDNADPTSAHPATDRIELSDGTVLHAHATVLALGWTPVQPTPEEQTLAAATREHPQLHWVAANNPADQDLDPIHPANDSGEQILIRGLGMGFFDVMSMLTVGRGGSFISDATAPAGLRYHPSGREPRILATAGRGYPHQPRPEFEGMPPTLELPRLHTAIDRCDAKNAPANSLDFGQTLWPALLRDAQETYYEVLLAEDPAALARVRKIIDDPATDPLRMHEDSRLDGLVTAEDRFNIPWENDPVSRLEHEAKAEGETMSVNSFTRRLAEHLTADWHQAQLGPESAVKMGLFTFAAAQKPIQLCDEPGRFTTESRQGAYKLFGSIAQMATVGPPAYRTAELLALIGAGLVRFLGADPTLLVDEEEPAFVMSSPTTGEEPVHSTVLVDALIHAPDIRHTSCPLSQQLLAARRMRDWTWGDGTETSAPEVDLATGRLIGVDGQPDARVHLLGLPLQEVRADVTNSPKVGEDPVIFQETDAAARSALAIALA